MYKFGVISKPQSIRDYDFELVATGTSNIPLVPIDELPDEYILPEELIPSIHDQRDTMKCVAFAMCQAAESARKKIFGEEVHYSEDWNYARKESRSGYNGEGLFTQCAVSGALKIGFVPSHYFDYSNLDAPEILEPASTRDDLLEIGSRMRPSAFASFNYALDSKKWDTVRQALYSYQTPLVIVSDTFFGGSHAVLMIGWSKKNGKQIGQYIEFQNSWGTDYKENGRYRFSLGYLDQAYIFLWDDLKLPFTDVSESDWFFKEVNGSYFAGLIQGTSDTTFDPSSNIIRGDLAVILDRYLKKCQQSYNAFVVTMNNLGKNFSTMALDSINRVPFEDIVSTDYWYDSILSVYANCLMNGITNTTFDPKSSVTRAMMAAIAVRAFELVKSKLDVDVPLRVYCNNFKDVEEGQWYTDYIADAYGYGLVSGDGENYRPEDPVTRAEAAVILYRLFKETDTLFSCV